MKTTRPFSLPEMKRLFPLYCLVLFLVFTGILSASELHLSTFIVPYRSYTFDYWRKAVEGPIAYLPKAVITAEEIGVENLRQPKDIFVDKNNDIYIADTGNNRILHLDSEWNLKRIIDGFINQGEKDTFSRPNSLVITADQYMYVADTGNARVVQLDQNGDLVRIYTSPHVDNEGVFDANFNFRPLKIGVNEKGTYLFYLRTF